jgi:cytochrome c556
MKFNKIIVATLAIGLAGTAMGQVVGKAEDQIRWRQSAYQTMAWNMTRIKANVDGTYNKDQVVQAANVIQAIATSGMGALYQADTNSGKGWRETNVKPEFFKPESKDEIGKLAGAYIKEAKELATVAANGDAAAVKAQFGKLGKACDACHDKFRKELK